MQTLRSMQFCDGTREEFLEDFSMSFPYTSLRIELSKYKGALVPWHWHKKAVEFFWVQSGSLECFTPTTHMTFPSGWAEFINANVMHMRKVSSTPEEVVQLLHIFEPSLIATPGSQIEKKYVLPVIASSQTEILAFNPQNKTDRETIERMLNAFRLSSE